MQKMYMSKLLELAERDKNVLHLIADSGTGYDKIFQHNFPGQILEFGIAEEHMVAAAAGMATAGKIPFVFTTGAFLAYRSFEFIRNDICFQNLNVKLVGFGSGLALCSLGPSHHTTEDVAVLRAIPNLKILSPATPIQVAACVEEAYRYNGPVYIRIGMNDEQEFYPSDYQLPKTGQDVLKDDGKLLLMTTGTILEEVMEAAEKLQTVGINSTVVNVTAIKPFSDELFLQKAKQADIIVTVEEHNVIGGLAGIIAETMVQHGVMKRFFRIGLKDTFAIGYGKTQNMVRKQNHLDAESIAGEIMEIYK